MKKYAAAAAAPVPGEKWAELLGSKNWDGLMDPVDEDLREHLLRCGSFCFVVGESIITDPLSKYYGENRYPSADILTKIFFKQTADYEVFQDEGIKDAGYLYTNVAYQNLREFELMGFVAVSKDKLYHTNGRREIYVVWRGTVGTLELNEDLNTSLVSFGPEQSGVKIMKGWNDIYTQANADGMKPSAQYKLKKVIGKIVDKYKNEKLSIICVGHSLGGPLAIVSAFDIASSGLIKDDIQVCAVAFEGPKVGNQAFNDALLKLKNTKVFRVNNLKDEVPKWPFTPVYVDTGIILHIDSEKSKYLKTGAEYPFGFEVRGKIKQWHDLPVILHTVAGWTSSKDTFNNYSEEMQKSLPLVNRWAGHLKADYKVVEGWCVDKYKGMHYNVETHEWQESKVPRD